MRPLMVVFIAALSLAGCVDEAPMTGAGTARAPIVNGEIDPFDPGIVALTIRGHAFCTGTLVSPRLVVTAAHCVEEGDVADIRVQAGVRVGDGEAVGVLTAKVHDDYVGSSHDIALLLLEDPAPARSWPLNHTPFDSSFIGKQLRVAGYGATDPDGRTDGKKRTGTGEITSFDALDFAYESAPSQTCFGDSGGPGFLTLDDGIEYLAGVTSRGDSQCAVLGIDTRIDVYADWIQFYIAVNDPTVTDCGEDCTCALDCDAPDPDCPCEADGYCATACETLNVDRDCPANCDHDGVCQSESGCPVADIDCNPTAVIGEPCVFDTTCIEGACTQAIEDERVTYCSEACSGDTDCPGEMVCIDDVEGGDTAKKCRHLAPSPGAQGWPCAQDNECYEERCLPVDSGDYDRICVDHFVSDVDCGDSFVCGRTEASEKVCLPEEAGCGCVVGARDAPARSGAMLLLLLGLAWLRRRR